MTTKRIIITGAPGSGKTALISELEKNGFSVMHEISRDVIKNSQQRGMNQPFLENPFLFSQQIMEGRLKQFESAKNYNAPFLFYGRGLPDITAYLNYLNLSVPIGFTEIYSAKKYDLVFILPPWEEIYLIDNERYETFEQARCIHKFLFSIYENSNHPLCEIPKGTLLERVGFIIKKLNHFF